jgi:hypothetical protein
MGRRYGFLLGFLPFSFTETVRGYVNLKKEKSQGNAVEVTVNNKEENSLTLNTFVWIRPRIRPLASLHASTLFFISGLVCL